MSKVYGFCKAGCKYPVVKEDDFLKAAAFIEMDTNILEVKKKYKIFEKTANNWSLKIIYKFKMDYRGNVSEQSVELTLPVFDKYEPYLTFRLCDVKVSDIGTSMTITYDVNDVRKTYTYNTNDHDASVVLIDNACTVENAKSIRFINEDGGYTLDIDGSGGVSEERVQEMIDEAITSALTGDY